MPTYKLTYFPARGRAELVRLIFHASGTKFEDVRIEGKNWPALKPKIPLGKLPALEVDGQIYGQSIAIARYIAKQTGLAGKTPTEEFKADELVDTIGDFAQAYIKVRFEKDETKKAELKKELEATTMPNFLENLTKALKGNFYVGTSLTWADLAAFNTLDMLVNASGAVLDKSPELKAFKKRIEEIPSISTYLKARPASDM